MMKISEDEMIKIAKLAMLEISPDEKDDFLNQANRIVEYIDKINELDTSNVEPTVHIFELKNVFREDKVRQSIDSNELKKIVPDYKDGYIVVPKIIE
ncbi:MAG: Asp-tRNA(Asn)/Glu-tRNA(Gln) amidotransferase subunit GatC [Leptospirales bacterium]|nr:Asp-tRNA(Asn)/Glu-tRNA(Gln) amidotransferase subunit GatC [Leptospirales bacterium]